MAKLLLEAAHIGKHFGGVVAVDDVSAQVHEGAIHAVIGPNGAGKTTFFNTLTGFYFPDAGRVTFAGSDITRMPNWQRVAAGLGRTFQTPSIFPELSVHDNLQLGIWSQAGQAFRLRGGTRAHRQAVEARIDELLGFVNLTRARARLVAELSHGAQRLCEIALSLSTNPRLVLLDEPMAGLAEAETERIVGVIQDLHARLGLSVLFVEHNMRVVLSLADRITVMDRGRLLAEGTPGEISANDAVRDAYLGKDVIARV